MADVEQLGAIQVKPDVKLGDNTTLPEADASAVETEQCLKTNPGYAPIKPEHVFH